MANINKIRISGTSYDIQDKNAPKVVELTQAQYDALVDKDPNVFYIITDAQASDLTNYYTKTETNTLLGGKADTATTYTKTEVDNAITAATSTKQDTLVSSVNIKTINNESLLGSGNITIQGGGGGKAIEAGRGITVTTGETADTVSFNLPISAGTGTNSLTFGYDDASLQQYIPKAIGKYSIAGGSGCSAMTENSVALGYNNKASGNAGVCGNFAQGYMTTASGNRCHSEGLVTSATSDASHSEGYNTVASGNYSHSEGEEVKATNVAEHSQGRYNVSNKASSTWGDSGNTLFSVGNGTADNARHNAFEIRQNGDIYLSSGGTDIKLQDHLGGGGSITIDPSLDSGSTNAVANSAITTALNDTVKLSNLSTYYINGFTNYVNRTIPIFHRFDINNQSNGNAWWFGKINDKYVITTGQTSVTPSDLMNLQVVETSAITTSITSASTDSQVPSAKAVNDKLGGLSLVKLTQAQYDALATKDSNVLYVIVG